MIVKPVLEKWGLTVNDEFWFFLSLGLVSLLYTFNDPGILVPLIFFGGGFISLMLTNNVFFRRTFLTTPSEKKDDYVKNIGKMEFNEALEFIKGNELTNPQLKKIMKSRHKDNYTLYQYIYQYQDFDSDLIIFMAENKLESIMRSSLFLKFLFSVKDFASVKDYKKLKRIFKDNPKILKGINMMYPMYLPDSTFKNYANFIVNLRNTLNYGSIEIFVFIFSLIFTGKVIYDSFGAFLSPLGYTGLILIIEIIVKIGIFLTLSFIVTKIIMYLIVLFIRSITYLLYFFSPANLK